MKAEFLRLSDWVRGLRHQHGGRVSVRIVDPQSLAGIWRLLRHRIRRYPAFLLEGELVVGWEADPDGAIARALARRDATVAGGVGNK